MEGLRLSLRLDMLDLVQIIQEYMYGNYECELLQSLQTMPPFALLRQYIYVIRSRSRYRARGTMLETKVGLVRAIVRAIACSTE